MKQNGLLHPFALIALLAAGIPTVAGAQTVSESRVGQRQIGAEREVATPVAGDVAVGIPASLQDIYRRLAESWESEDARAIADLAREGRVYVSIQREGVGDRLAASQLVYLLEDMFESSEEVEFRFPAYSAYDPTAATGYAVGERFYTEGPGVERRDRVFVGTRNEHGRWVLTELRLTID